MTTEQIKAARMLLGWDQVELAKRAGLGVATLRRLEAIPGPAQGTQVSLDKIAKALTDAGVRFLPQTKVAGIGVRLTA
ncbi:helix-turn-helix transcriptional regulator [Methylocella sp. CPCC 101449]|uniref:helix-turn-helix domain-containing protein n=1 Tax=Methylocella sp. CPCC 101449 TaxID=2987531 RepID=UPI00288D1935|nr:helix-turn-helix transcriptional regulator [Methylocella sp. CPCC 101449]MDT2019476.1 helix-turn-helix transcriptional regulator [Methylocella sp. CPCC 101449]